MLEDKLVTVYQLVDHYTAPMNRVIDANQRFMRSNHVVKAGIHGIGTALTLAGAAASGITLGMVAFGVAAIRTHANLEQIEARLKAITGSAELARKKLEFMRELAAPSPFTFQQLAEAGVQLEAFGLRIERVLPLISKLGSVFGADTEQLLMAVRLFGRLAAGDFPDIETISRFGLSRQEFAAKGIKFDASGKLLSSAQETLAALEQLIQEKYGGATEEMQNKTTTKLASVADAWEKFLGKSGDVLAESLIPNLDRLIEILDRLSQSPGLLHLLDFMGKTFEAIATNIANSVEWLDKLGKKLRDIFGITSPHDPDRLKVPEVPFQGLGGLEKLEPSGDWFGRTRTAQEQIAENTRLIAEQTRPILDLQRFALGGGPLGQIGVTPFELAGGRRSVNLQVQVGGIRNLEQGITDLIQQIVTQMRRQGVI